MNLETMIQTMKQTIQSFTTYTVSGLPFTIDLLNHRITKAPCVPELVGAKILSVTKPNTGFNEVILSIPHKRLLLSYSEGEMLRSLFQTVKEREVKQAENHHR